MLVIRGIPHIAERMTDLRVVHFTEIPAFFDAVKSYDDGFMNFALGTLYNRLEPGFSKDGNWEQSTASQRVILAVYKGDDLM